jgi:hypothetical protein
MAEGPADPKEKGSLTGAGCALVGIGLLILVPSGLCTGVMMINSLAEVIRTNQPGYLWVLLTYVMGIGLIPILLGAGLLWAGLSRRKK